MRNIALSASSPALDHGNNAQGLGIDQRSIGYVREYGAAPDIGAFELQPSDLIFQDPFDDL